MRVIAAVLVAALLAPSALAGENPMVHVALGKKFSLNFDLGFKLPCKHQYEIVYTDSTIIEQVKPPDLTGSTSFKFVARRVGMTTATAFFMGPGGNCSGSDSASVDIMVLPDQKFTEKAWKTAVKADLGGLRSALDELANGVEDEVDSIMAAFKAEELSSLEAADAVTEAVTNGTVEAAGTCWTLLYFLGAEGTSILEDGGFEAVLPSFQSGARESLWDEATYDAREEYEEWAEDAYDFLDDALEFIAKSRPSFVFISYVDPSLPFELPQGPTVSTDPSDSFAAAARIVAGAGWNDGGTGSLRWIGTGLIDNGAINLDALGPQAFVQTLQPAQSEIFEGGPFGKWTYSTDALTLPGSYRLEVRYASDETTSSKVTVTLPAPNF